MDTPTKTQDSGLKLPTAKAYLSEAQVAEMLGFPLPAFRKRPEGQRPPAIKLSPRKRIYDPDDLAAWIASLPRTK